MEHVIGPLYDALDDVNALDGALRAFAQRLGASVASFVVLERLVGSTIAMRSINAPQSAYSRYPNLIAFDPWFEAAARIPKPGVFIGSQLVDRSEGQRSRYYRELLEPNRMGFMLGCGLVGRSMGAFISAHRASGKSDYSASTAKCVGELIPHVLRVARMMVDRSHSAELQDTGTFPMIRIGRHGVEFTNERARDWLKQSRDVALVGNRLRLKDHEADRRLSNYLCCVLAGDPSKVSTTPLEVAAGSDRRAFRLLVLPTIATGPVLAREPAVLIVILDGYWRLSKWHAGLLGISEAEALLANALMVGQSTTEHARCRKRSIHTVRSQLKALLSKVGVHTQAQLVRKLLLLGAGES